MEELSKVVQEGLPPAKALLVQGQQLTSQLFKRWRDLKWNPLNDAVDSEPLVEGHSCYGRKLGQDVLRLSSKWSRNIC